MDTSDTGASDAGTDAADGRQRWAVAAVLADGDTAYIRPITRADAPALLAFHLAQPREALYLRFFSAKPTLSEQELVHFTDIDFRDRVALVMEVRGEFIAWASYERWAGRHDADVAFMVDHRQRGRGIATLLLEHLAAIARSNGINRFTAEVLYENKSMLRVFGRAGWPVKRHFDSGVTELEFSLNDTEQFIGSVEQREHRADSSAVARLLLPRTVAVIGASNTPDTAGHELWRNVSSSFGGAVYPVNPLHETIDGRRSYASVADIDDDIWLAVIAVPAADLVATIDTCIAKRVRGAVVITAVDGTDIDVDALIDHARRNGLRIIGPASMGIASPDPASRMQASLVNVALPAGGVAISMQSGSLGAALLQLAGRLSMGISWFVSLGDKSDISGNDLLQFWEDDQRIKVIAMYTESFGNPRKFARIARRVSRKRPIVAVRAGAAAIGSGTAALYQESGLIEVPGVRAMLDMVRVLADQPLPPGPNVAVLTNSRSPGVLAADALATAGLRVVAPPVPLDFRSTFTDFEVAIRAAVADPGVDAVLVVHAPPLATSAGPTHEIDAAARGSAKPVLAVMLGHDDGPILPGSPVPTFSFPENAAFVLGRMHAYACWRTEAADVRIDDDTEVDAAGAALAISAAIAEGAAVLDLERTWTVLAAYGLATAPARVVRGDVADVVRVADALGYPVAVKSTRRRIGRSAQAGIALDLSSANALAEAVKTIRGFLGEDADELIVQRMIAPGVDVRVRSTFDELVGSIVTIDLASQQVDAPRDRRSSRLAPLSTTAATTLVQSSPVGAALAASGLAIEPVVDAIVRVSHLVADHPQLAEVDINPMIVSTDGCVVTDARVTLRAVDRSAPAMRRLG
ncbi:MAG: putative acetyltransferase [Ilumatobacteraceae bacterium]|nr:putative acetyltransferase [Ilumatobacteraceae bacterium]